jgi:hypothetical protein
VNEFFVFDVLVLLKRLFELLVDFALLNHSAVFVEVFVPIGSKVLQATRTVAKAETVESVPARCD